MIKRVAVYLLALIVVAVAAWYFGVYRPTSEARRSSRDYLKRIDDQEKSLAALGDIRIDPKDLSYSKLIAVLGQPKETVKGPHRSTRDGWACRGEGCAIWAFFLTPDEGSMPVTAPVLALRIAPPGLNPNPHILSVGGVIIGEPIDQLAEIARHKTHSADRSPNRAAWDANWDVIWTAENERITSLYFLNMTELDRAAPNAVD